MRALFLAVGIALTFSGTAFGGAAHDCDQDKDQDLAIRGCTLLIEGRARGNKVFAFNNRGTAYGSKGEYDRAIADYDQAIALNPKLVEPYNNRGNAYNAKGEYDRAIADFDQAIALNSRFALAYRNRCSAYSGKGEFDRAIADCDRAIRLDPKSDVAYNVQAWTLFKAGKLQEARLNADKATALNPKSVDAFDTRGHILLAFNEAKAALDDFNASLRLKPDIISSLWGRGQVYEEQGLRSLALADYQKAVELKAADTDSKDAQNKARARLIVLDAPAVRQPAPVQASTEAQAKGRRVALVIGNSAYKAVSELPNPRNDAAVVAAELTRLGFEVIEKHDLGVAGMRRVLGEFEDKSAGAEWAFVYYAGHGMELDGRNWLIPVDAQLARATDAPDEAVPLERVLDRLSAATKLRVVILDACRNNPFMSRMVMSRVSTRAVARGLTAVEPSHGEVVFYAARDGNVASDGKGANSPFATALVKHMDEDGVELGRFFRRVTSTVLAQTNNQQEPFVYGRIPDEGFYFKPPK